VIPRRRSVRPIVFPDEGAPRADGKDINVCEFDRSDDDVPAFDALGTRTTVDWLPTFCPVSV
jgi:hypothetical protein